MTTTVLADFAPLASGAVLVATPTPSVFTTVSRPCLAHRVTVFTFKGRRIRI